MTEIHYQDYLPRNNKLWHLLLMIVYIEAMSSLASLFTHFKEHYVIDLVFLTYLYYHYMHFKSWLKVEWYNISCEIIAFVVCYFFSFGFILMELFLTDYSHQINHERIILNNNRIRNRQWERWDKISSSLQRKIDDLTSSNDILICNNNDLGMKNEQLTRKVDTLISKADTLKRKNQDLSDKYEAVVLENNTLNDKNSALCRNIDVLQSKADISRRKNVSNICLRCSGSMLDNTCTKNNATTSSSMAIKSNCETVTVSSAIIPTSRSFSLDTEDQHNPHVNNSVSCKFSSPIESDTAVGYSSSIGVNSYCIKIHSNVGVTIPDFSDNCSPYSSTVSYPRNYSSRSNSNGNRRNQSGYIGLKKIGQRCHKRLAKKKTKISTSKLPLPIIFKHTTTISHFSSVVISGSSDKYPSRLSTVSYSHGYSKSSNSNGNRRNRSGYIGVKKISHRCHKRLVKKRARISTFSLPLSLIFKHTTNISCVPRGFSYVSLHHIKKVHGDVALIQKRSRCSFKHVVRRKKTSSKIFFSRLISSKVFPYIKPTPLCCIAKKLMHISVENTLVPIDIKNQEKKTLLLQRPPEGSSRLPATCLSSAIVPPVLPPPAVVSWEAWVKQNDEKYKLKKPTGPRNNRIIKKNESVVIKKPSLITSSLSSRKKVTGSKTPSSDTNKQTLKQVSSSSMDKNKNKEK